MGGVVKLKGGSDGVRGGSGLIWGGVCWGRSLGLWDGDGRALGVVEAVHGVQLQDHVEAVGEKQHHEKAGHQAHPDSWREEAGAVAGVRELAITHIEALDLQEAEPQVGNNTSEKQ